MEFCKFILVYFYQSVNLYHTFETGTTEIMTCSVLILASPVSGRDIATAWAVYCGLVKNSYPPVTDKDEPQHWELHTPSCSSYSFIFPKSYFPFSETNVLSFNDFLSFM